MSDTLEKAIGKVVDAVIDSCISIVQASKTFDPADSHEQLKAVIVRNLQELRDEGNDGPVRLPN